MTDEIAFDVPDIIIERPIEHTSIGLYEYYNASLASFWFLRRRSCRPRLILAGEPIRSRRASPDLRPESVKDKGSIGPRAGWLNMRLSSAATRR